MEFKFDGLIRFGADVRLRPTGLGAEALERPLLDLPPDAGQIRREKTFTAEKFAYGLAAVLRFQINLELLFSAQLPAFLFGTRIRGCGWIATAHQ